MMVGISLYLYFKYPSNILHNLKDYNQTLPNYIQKRLSIVR